MKFNREDRCRLNLEFFIARRTARTSPENRPGVMSRIAVVSVAVSVAVMLVALAVILGFKREVTARMVGFSAPVEVIDGQGKFLMPGLIFLPHIFDVYTEWNGSWGVWCSMPLSLRSNSSSSRFAPSVPLNVFFAISRYL